MQNYSSWSNRRWNKQYQLMFASSCVDPKKNKSSNYGAYITKRNFLMSLGLMGSIYNEFSIFSRDKKRVTRTLYRIDKRLIKLHYHEAIKPGLFPYDLRKAIEGIQNIDELATEKL